MSRFILALCTGTLALGMAFALPTFAQAAPPAPAGVSCQPVSYRAHRGPWYRHYHYRGHWHRHHRR
jgi:hypothetical protein